MFNKLYQRLLADASRTLTDDKARQQIYFRWILKILFVVVILAGIANLLTGNIRMTLFLFMIALTYFGQYWIVYYLKDTGTTIVSIIMNVEVFLICLLVIITGGSDGFSPIWILIMPQITFLLTGRKIGTLGCVVIFLMMIFFFWVPAGKQLLLHQYEPMFMTRFPAVFFVMTLITFFTETLRIATVKELNLSQKRMEAVFKNEYSTMNSRISEARRARHDIRHHFVMISTLLNDGKVEEAQQYIDQYYKALPFEESLTYCEHYATNALLTYFVQRANTDGIQYQVDVKFPTELEIPTDDLTVILGNLLENALDASLQSKQEKPDFETNISVKGIYKNQMLILQIENNTLHPAKMDSKNRFISSKHEGLGIGVDSARIIAEKYNGNLTVEQPESKFIVKIVLNLHQNRNGEA